MDFRSSMLVLCNVNHTHQLTIASLPSGNQSKQKVGTRFRDISKSHSRFGSRKLQIDGARKGSRAGTLVPTIGWSIIPVRHSAASHEERDLSTRGRCPTEVLKPVLRRLSDFVGRPDRRVFPMFGMLQHDSYTLLEPDGGLPIQVLADTRNIGEGAIRFAGTLGRWTTSLAPRSSTRRLML